MRVDTVDAVVQDDDAAITWLSNVRLNLFPAIDSSEGRDAVKAACAHQKARDAVTELVRRRLDAGAQPAAIVGEVRTALEECGFGHIVVRIDRQAC